MTFSELLKEGASQEVHLAIVEALSGYCVMLQSRPQTQSEITECQRRLNNALGLASDDVLGLYLTAFYLTRAEFVVAETIERLKQLG
jgi:hypothetical protein